MCGITGIYNLTNKPVCSAEISAQIETIVHRGPNQGATYLSPPQNCGLGIRRLSIIDVAGGHQPLSNETGSLRLVYNGETYNHRSLRAELEALGHWPKSHSDGEVILHGYEAWGPAGVLQKLRGMFAFALWDDARQLLFLARDRFGVKPLYYAQHAGRLYFASEIKAILADPNFPRRVNVSALQAMLTLGFVPGPATMFEGICKLPPAHFLLAHHGAWRLQKYWQLDYLENRHITEAEATEQFLALLAESVRLRLMSEVPLGALLSGGLDSGTLVGLMQREMKRQPDNNDPSVFGHKLKTVSIGFEQADYDETPLARNLAQVMETEHHTVTFGAADFDIYPAVIYHLEEPQCSATAVPIYRLYQTCRQAGLTVVLTGEGSDELLGGYHWHKGDALVRRLLWLPASLRRLIADSSLPMTPAARRALARGARDIPTRYRDWLETPGHNFRQRLLAGDVTATLDHNGSNPLLMNWAEKLVNLKNNMPLHHMLWLETQTRLADFINFEVDKMSMAHSIEARTPFLDHKLWEFCVTLPPRYKLKGRTEKYLLRRATQNILPEATRTRRKKGLASPYARWLQQHRLPEWAEAALSQKALQQAGLFDPATAEQLRQAHQAGQPGLGALLMGVLSMQVWHHCFINK
jgi:asparagine synthase (glutamine-hydrolysing)